MGKIVFIAILMIFLHVPAWHYNMQEAKQIAQKEQKHILLNFSGSDWCGPCILLRKEILDQPAFLQMADTELVLVNADFPRKKKDQLPEQQQQWNNALADQYNPQGKFPYTLLLDANGKVLKEWEGYPKMTPESFSIEVRNGIYADKNSNAGR
jgi:thioredoxin-related protein